MGVRWKEMKRNGLFNTSRGFYIYEHSMVTVCGMLHLTNGTVTSMNQACHNSGSQSKTPSMLLILKNV